MLFASYTVIGGASCEATTVDDAVKPLDSCDCE